jgi:hypothetical protein
LAQAKKVALRASKGMLDQATRGEKKLKVFLSYLGLVFLVLFIWQRMDWFHMKVLLYVYFDV